MYKDKKILAIIPARGGSKGLPKKNIRPLLGKPLIGWTIEQAKESKYIDEIFVSTDSQEIADVSGNFGIKVPFLRPPELAKDDSATSDAILHVLNELKNSGKTYDYVALLEPTSPLRKDEDIDNALKKLIDDKNADGLVTVGLVHMEHPLIVKKIVNNFVKPYIDNCSTIYQRQQADKAYFPYGVIYISKVDIYIEKKSFYLENTISYEIERWQNYEIDDEIDFMIAEQILKLKLGE